MCTHRYLPTGDLCIDENSPLHRGKVYAFKKQCDVCSHVMWEDIIYSTYECDFFQGAMNMAKENGVPALINYIESIKNGVINTPKEVLIEVDKNRFLEILSTAHNHYMAKLFRAVGVPH